LDFIVIEGAGVEVIFVPVIIVWQGTNKHKASVLMHLSLRLLPRLCGHCGGDA
jgi:hypothetical protein